MLRNERHRGRCEIRKRRRGVRLTTVAMRAGTSQSHVRKMAATCATSGWRLGRSAERLHGEGLTDPKDKLWVG